MSKGVPDSTIFPPYMIFTVSAYRATTPRLWVIMISAVLDSFRSLLSCSST